MPYHREDDGFPIATITCALVFIYKTTTHTFTHFILYYVSLESRKYITLTICVTVHVISIQFNCLDLTKLFCMDFASVEL